MEIQQALDELYPHLNRASWRIIAALTEEAGEVQGAFNKIMDKRADKPKTREDIIEETSQLLGNCLIVGKHYGVSASEMLRLTSEFMEKKKIQLAGWGTDYSDSF